MIKKSKLEIRNLKKGAPRRPFFCLAPMANITTYPFASQCAKYGADLVWTPMVHTDTIINNWEEASKVLDFKEIKNYIIQIVGSEPDNFSRAIKIIEKKGLRPVGFDINTGCPDKNIVKSGCGGCLMKSPEKIVQIVESCKKATDTPISVKTRAGYDNLTDIYDLAPRLIEAGISMLTIHPRTVKQGYSGVAEWDVIKNVKKKIKNIGCLVIGSGDIKTWQDAVGKQKETGCDGVMIGRGALGRPWIFQEINERKDISPDIQQIKELALDLAQKANSIWGDHGITEARKHFAWYFRGFDGAKELRMKLMEADTIEDVRTVLNS